MIPLQGIAVAAVVFAAANYAPIKNRETMQDELSETLPKATLSLEEIKDFIQDGYYGAGFRRLVHMDDADIDMGQEVTFPDRHVSLRQFMAAINEQTPLRVRLSGGCGNGSTILWGVTPWAVTVTKRE